ncbi:MAG: alanine racemase [Paracoccaceae bacterium]
MGQASLTIDLDAIGANWRAIDRLSAQGTQTAAVVKADGYGLSAPKVARALAEAGARRFFVALAQEASAVRLALGPGPQINVLSGHMDGDAALIRDLDLTPMINSIDQLTRHLDALPGHPFGAQLDTGMSRLGMSPAEWHSARDIVMAASPEILISHLACADDPDHALNAHQLAIFHQMTDGTNVPRSLAATGGIMLGPQFHFDLTRPGIGLYGGLPFEQATRVVGLSLPVIQTRVIEAGDVVGYSGTYKAAGPTKVATLASGYADGLLRSLSNRAILWHHDIPCPLIGRVSMDLVTVDISNLKDEPNALDLLGPWQNINDLASMADTISYEILTALGLRYRRLYLGAGIT